MARYRCHLCPPAVPNGSGFEFDVDFRAKPECPTCGSTEASGGLSALVTTHYEAPLSEHMRGRKGCGRIACDPATRVPAAGVAVTGNTAVVNCAACMRSDVWHNDAHFTGHHTPAQEAFVYRKFHTEAKAADEDPVELRESVAPVPAKPLGVPGMNDPARDPAETEGTRRPRK